MHRMILYSILLLLIWQSITDQRLLTHAILCYVGQAYFIGRLTRLA